MTRVCHLLRAGQKLKHELCSSVAPQTTEEVGGREDVKGEPTRETNGFFDCKVSAGVWYVLLLREAGGLLFTGEKKYPSDRRSKHERAR